MSDLEEQKTLDGKTIFKFRGERAKPKRFDEEKKGGLSRFEQEE